MKIPGPLRTLSPSEAKMHSIIATQINALSEGRMVARYAALTAAPTTGTWAVGDEVKNSAPSELGSTGSKYVIDGWKCVVAGTPGTWVQMRFLTGN